MENDFIPVMFHISLTTSVIIASLLLLTPLLHKRYIAQWRYYVWLIIAVRLLIPVNISLPKTIVSIQIPKIVMPITAPLVTFKDEEPAIAIQPDEKLKTVSPITENPTIIPSPTEMTTPSIQTVLSQDSERMEQFSLIKLLEGLWLSGVVVLLFVQAFTYIRFLRKLHYYPRYVITQTIQEVYWQAGKEMKITRLPEIRVCSATPSPILTGVFRPTLLLPHDRYSQRELLFILRHELVHFRRRDLLYKLTLAAAKIVHWFNPFVWLMAAQADRDIELSCDDLVMAGLSDDDRLFYGDTILNTLPIKSRWRLEPMFTTSFGSTKKNMKNRLKNLFDRSLKKKGIVEFLVVSIFTIFISGIMVITPAIAAVSEKTKTTSSSMAFSNNDDGASRVMLGPYALKKDESCTVTIIWNEGGTQTLQFIKETTTGKESTARTEHHINSGTPLTVTAWEDGNYRFVIPYGKSMTGIVCVVDYESVDESDKTSIINEYVSFDSVVVLTYENNAAPYIHDIRSNHTKRNIVSYERGMLAFDKNGQPLKVKWFPFDSDRNPTYYYLYKNENDRIPAGTTANIPGGWSLDGSNEPSQSVQVPGVVKEIRYILYNLKQITFDDGTVWVNPEYENWLKTYEGKKSDVNILNKYYPYAMEIHQSDIKTGVTHPLDIAEPIQDKLPSAVTNKPNQNEVDNAAIELMQYSGNWDIVELLIPNMSKDGINKLVEIYNQKNPSTNSKKASDYYNVTGASADERALTMMQKNGSWKYTSTLFPFITSEGFEKVVALYNQKNPGKKITPDFNNYTTSSAGIIVIN